MEYVILIKVYAFSYITNISQTPILKYRCVIILFVYENLTTDLIITVMKTVDLFIHIFASLINRMLIKLQRAHKIYVKTSLFRNYIVLDTIIFYYLNTFGF